MAYNGLTDIGAIYLAECLAYQKPVIFTKIKVGDGSIPADKTGQTTTELYSFKKEAEILSKEQYNSDVKLTILLNNLNLEQGFYVKELGIYVDDNGTEKLYWYINKDTPSFLFDKNTPSTHRYNVYCEVSSNESTVINFTGEGLLVDKKFVKDSIKNANDYLINDFINKKQNINDNSLKTVNKNIPGAINELYEETKRDRGERLPIGTVVPFVSDNIPLGYLLCDGREITRDKYQELYDTLKPTSIKENDLRLMADHMIPQLNSNNQNGYVVSVSSMYSSEYDGYKALDNSDSTVWVTQNGQKKGWIKIKYPKNQIIESFRIKPYSQSKKIRKVTLFGISNNIEEQLFTEDILIDLTNNEYKMFKVPFKAKEYQEFKIEISNDATDPYCGISELKIYTAAIDSLVPLDDKGQPQVVGKKYLPLGKFGDGLVKSGENENGKYRIYASGYIEQWGKGYASGGVATVTLPIPMNNNIYNVSANAESSGWPGGCDIHTLTKTNFKMFLKNYENSHDWYYTGSFFWKMNGYLNSISNTNNLIIKAKNAPLADNNQRADGNAYMLDGKTRREFEADLAQILEEKTVIPTGEIKNGYYIRPTVRYVEDTNYYTSEFINISNVLEGTDILIKASLSIPNAGVLLLDRNKNIVDYIDSTNAVDKGYNVGSEIQDVKISKPANAKYIVTTIRSAYFTSKEQDFAIKCKITKANVYDGAITSEKLANKSVTAEKLDDSLIENKICYIGKNKFNASKSQNGFLNSSSGDISNSDVYKTSEYIDVSKFNNNVCIYPRTRKILQYSSNKAPIKETYRENAEDNPIFEPNRVAKYIRVTYFKEDENILQIEDSNVHTSYEKFNFTLKENINVLNKTAEEKIKILINKSDIVSDIQRVIEREPVITEGYLQANGTYGGEETYHSKNISYDCKKGYIFSYKGIGASSTVSYIMKSGDTIIKTEQINNIGEFDEPVDIIIPEGVDNIIFSSYALKDNDIVLEVILKNPAILETQVKKLWKDTYPIDYTTTEQNGFLIANETYTGTSEYHSKSIYCKCNKGDIFAYKGIGRSQAVSYIMKNGDTIISTGQINNTQTFTDVIIPEGVDNIIFSSFDFKKNDIILEVILTNSNDFKSRIERLEKNDKSNNNLNGKKWCHFGDSFSDYTNKKFIIGKFSNKSMTYPRLIAEKTGIILDERFFKSGRTMAYPADKTFDNSATSPKCEGYYQNIPDDVDYVTIMLGINDINHTNGSGTTPDGEDATGVIKLGTINDTSTDTYYGAYNTVLQWLRNNRPFAHVGIIITNGTESENYVNAQIEVSKKWGFPYLNLNGDERTPAFIRCYNPNLSPELKQVLKDKQGVDPTGTITGKRDTHPNWQTHILESSIIENFLRSL